MLDKKTKHADPLHTEEKKADFEALIEHIKANPALYIAGVVFVLLAAVAGILVQYNSVQAEQKVAADYVKAIETDDPALRVTELQPVIDSKTPLTADGLYLAAESAYRAGDYDNAAKLYEQLRSQYPNSEFVPEAVEGLGYVAEEKGDFQGALDRYKEVVDKWPLTFAGRRQELNIGRAFEGLKEWQKAADAYQSQLQLFPDSSVATRAQDALDALVAAHPDVTVTSPDADASTENVPESAPAETSAEPAAPSATEQTQQPATGQAAPTATEQQPSTDTGAASDDASADKTPAAATDMPAGKANEESAPESNAE